MFTLRPSVVDIDQADKDENELRDGPPSPVELSGVVVSDVMLRPFPNLLECAGSRK